MKVIKRFLNWMKKNRGFAIVLILAIVLLLILCVIFISLLNGKSSNKYGNRLEGIEKVKIDNDTYDGVEEEIMDTELADEASVRLQGKIIYTTIVLKADTNLDKAKELAINTLDNYSEEELKFYDFSFFLKWKGEEGDTVVTGNKHHNLEEVSWINS